MVKRLKIAIVLFFLFGGVAVFLGEQQTMNVVKSSSNGPPPGFTGAPDENSCSACHGGNMGIGQFTVLSVPPNYLPGQTYQIQVRHTTTDPTRLRWGFEMTAIDSAGNGAGTFGDLSTATQVLSSNGRSYVEQTRIGSAAGQQGGALWTFNWIAPATNVGPIGFYAAGNQANNDQTSDGDEIYLASAMSLPTGATPTPTATPTSTPTATPTPQGFEADIAPRPNGDGNLLSSDVVQVRRFVVGLDQANTATSEYQRADSAPISTRGNGVLDSTDTVQTRRYVAGLDAPQATGGPTGPISAPGEQDTLLDDFRRYFFGSEVKVSDVVAKSGKSVTVVLDFSGSAEAAAASFTLDFDSTLLRNPVVELVEDGSSLSNLTVNYDHAAKGALGILIDSSERLGKIRITFDMADDSKRDETSIGFSDTLARRSLSDAFGDNVPVIFSGGIVSLQ